MEQGRRVFHQIVDRISRGSLFSQILEYQETRLQVKSFQLEKMPPQKALETYERIVAKYTGSNSMRSRSGAWYESQKRLFAWFMTMHSYLERGGQSIQVTCKLGILDEIQERPDFDFLSQVFFMKDKDFLEFHWLVLTRSAEKVEWKQDDQALLMEAIRIHGTQWNQVSFTIFMKSAKALFRSPKACRERWLNHLDQSKVKGNWSAQQDAVIFEYVLEKGKRWSKLVNVLGDKRTEHTIKNRFNSIIAKNRRYKFEKDVKVAARVLQQLKKKIEQGKGQQKVENSCSQAHFKVQNISPVVDENEKAEASIQVKVQVNPSPPRLQNDANNDEQQELELKREENNQIIYPFENYSYELQVYNQACPFQQNPMFYYQQIMPLPQVPTADTVSRQAKIQEQRRRRRQSEK